MILYIFILLVVLFTLLCKCNFRSEYFGCNQRSQYRIDVPYPAGMRIGQKGPFNVMTGAIDKTIFD